MALTKEELAELASLEAEEKKRKEDEADAIKRQHLQALRLRKTLAAKHGTYGVDFLVVETTAGNFGVRRPTDVESDGLDENGGRETIEKFVASVSIYPDVIEVQKAMASFPGLPVVLFEAAASLSGKAREEEAKK